MASVLTMFRMSLRIKRTCRLSEAVAARLKVPMEKWVTNIQDYGNTSSASALIALDTARRSGRVEPGQIMVFAAIGAGFSWGAGVLRT